MKCSHCGLKIPSKNYQWVVPRKQHPTEYYHPGCFRRELDYMMDGAKDVKGINKDD